MSNYVSYLFLYCYTRQNMLLFIVIYMKIKTYVLS